MTEIDPLTGLPKELGVWENIAKSDQRIVVKEEKRKFGKIITVISGINSKEIDIKELSKKLKAKFACGGTVKGNSIELQGNHGSKIKEALTNLGFSPDSIESR